MIETNINIRTRDAIRNAHIQRGAVLRGFFRRKKSLRQAKVD